jgi:hypothetical protein
MKKQFLALLCFLLLSSAASFAQPAKEHFEHVSTYGTSSGATLMPPDPANCDPGKVLTFDGTVYRCTDRISNACADLPDGRKQVVKSVDPATGAVTCMPLHAADTPCPAGQIQVGQYGDGAPRCGPRPAPSCITVQAGPSYGPAVAYCNDPRYPFVMNGGGHCSKSTSCNLAYTAGNFDVTWAYLNQPVDAAGVPPNGECQTPPGGNCSGTHGTPRGWAYGCYASAACATVVCCDHF